MFCIINKYIFVFIGNNSSVEPIEKIEFNFSENSPTLSWDECGFALYCHENDWTDIQQLSVSVSVYTSGDFIFSEKYKLVSSVYHITCDDKPFPATIKIQHCVNSSDQLTFAVSSDVRPPFHFSVVDGGDFVKNTGLLKVSKFSRFSVLWKWLFSTASIIYNIYLSHSRRPKIIDNAKMWDLSFYAFKKLRTLEQCFDNYIGTQNNFPHLVRFSVELEESAEELTFQYINNKPFMQFFEYAELTITRNEIDKYDKDSGCPPECKMIMKNTNLSISSFSVSFNITGVKPPFDKIKFHWPICGKLSTFLRTH